MPETHYARRTERVGNAVDDHFFRRYRELLDAEDYAFDELEHAYEDGDRAHFETRPRRLAVRRSSAAMTFLERHGLATAPLVGLAVQPLSVSARRSECRPRRVDHPVGAADEEVTRARHDLGRRVRPRRDLVAAPRSGVGTRRARASTRCFGRGSSATAANAVPNRSGGAIADPAVDPRVGDRQRHVGAERPADERDRHRRAPSRERVVERGDARRRGSVAPVAVAARAALDAAEVEAQAAVAGRGQRLEQRRDRRCCASFRRTAGGDGTARPSPRRDRRAAARTRPRARRRRR